MSVRTNGRPGPATAAMSTQVDVMLRARATPLEPFGCSLTVTPAELPLLREGLVSIMQAHGLLVRIMSRCHPGDALRLPPGP